MFRPHVLYNPATTRFVLWYKVKTSGETPHWYGVSTASTPAGPFRVDVAAVPGVEGTPSDHFLFQDAGQ